ncbi:hypothetical protein ACHHYP_09011 [Achlya hypogyna]|uniref:Uncharacterized protein n=1 Tax=Achlya hypogyna TaxID=1202772 RepID=A0A1V9ZJP0_ACHHY|nr:hypothetical protein ACHHYP_09011 [Achlya hypogyna]
MREALSWRAEPADRDETDDDDTTDRLFGIDSSQLLKSYLPSPRVDEPEGQDGQQHQHNTRKIKPTSASATARPTLFEASLKDKRQKSVLKEVHPTKCTVAFAENRVQSSCPVVFQDANVRKPRPASTGAKSKLRSVHQPKLTLGRWTSPSSVSPSPETTPLEAIRIGRLPSVASENPVQRLAEKMECLEAYIKARESRRSMATPRQYNKLDQIFRLRESQCPSPVTPASSRTNKPPVIQLAMWGPEARQRAATPTRAVVQVKDILVPKSPFLPRKSRFN